MTTGVLLLHGSSGEPDLDRKRLLENAGFDVVAPQWFDGRLCEIPLESFPLDELAGRVDRLCVLGISRGAEAALLLGTVDDRIDAVVALSPSAYVWGWVEDDLQRSAWTWRGEPLPFVPYDEDWAPGDDPPSYFGLYRQSLRVFPEQARAAEIPAERFRGDLLLVAGGDDRLWPSLDFARQLEARRLEAGRLEARRLEAPQGGLPTEVLTSPDAGHRPVFPGEQLKSGGQRMARGGSDEADRAFGAAVWPRILTALQG